MVYCVLCIVHCALLWCIAVCELYIVHCVLCMVHCNGVACIIYDVLCIVYCALRSAMLYFLS